jgi:hypothetical protein
MGNAASGRELDSINTGKNSTEVFLMSMYFVGIIRMEREGIEKAGVGRLMSGVQGMGISGGKIRI